MSARARRGLTLSWSALFVLSLVMQYFTFAAAPAALAAVGSQFELDGNAINQGTAGDDWDQVKAGTSSATSTAFVHDLVNDQADDTFKGSTGDDQAISAWRWVTAKASQAKNDIADVFASAYVDGSGHTIAYFGLDKWEADGDNFVGFWFFKSQIAPAGDGSTSSGDPFTGSHQVGDILVLADYTNGGGVATFSVYEWVGSGGDVGPNHTLDTVATGVPCTGAPVNACGVSNTDTVTSPWTFQGRDGDPGEFPAGTFFEGGIDLTALDLDAGCFTSFLGETRSSQSVSATLSDFAGGSFSFCTDATIETQVKQGGSSTGDNGHITIGQSVTDTATVTGNKGTAAGTVDFFVCGPSASTPDCTTGGTKVGATKSLSGGAATSDAFTPSAVGEYCFRVAYTPAAGSKYNAGEHTNTTSECFIVDKKQPTIATSAEQSVSVGSAVSDSAALSGATADATGHIVFRAYGPGDVDCSQPPAFTSADFNVSGNGTYGPASFTPSTAGVYRWIASYGGDAKNLAAIGDCNDDGENDTVNPVNPTIATQASASVAVGGGISDTATVSGGHSPTGSVTFRLYGPGDTTCQTVIFTSANRPLSGGSATSAAYTTTQAGTYRWIATYNGDVNNNPVAGSCNDANENVVVTKAQPSVSTSLVGGGKNGASITVVLGTAVHDTSTLSGATADAGGTVHYRVFTDPSCENLLADAGTKAVVNGVPGNSDNVTFNTAGTFYWQADYSGDANNEAASSACNLETVTVDKNIPTISTTASADVVVGGAIHDTAHLSGGFAATGTITFKLYGPDDATCQGAAVFTDTVTVNGNGDYVSGAYTATTAGTYRWVASYSGDANNAPVSGACNDADENVIVSLQAPTVTTQASASVVVGGTIHDTATLAGGFNPTGTITFQLYGPNDASCTGAVIFTDTVTVNGNGQYVSGNFTTTAAGTYRWIANYGGDANNAATSNDCNETNENVVVTPASPTVTTQASASVVVGGQIHDTATLAGGFNPTGTITFKLFGPDNDTCAGVPIFTSTVPVNGNGQYGSASFTTDAAGTYRWIANYNGDANNAATANTCNAANENVVVTPATPAISTVATEGAQVGDPIHDTASVTGGFNPTGTVTFTLYAPNDPSCDGAALFASTIALAADGTATSGSYTVLEQGMYHWIASYSGDANNESVSGACGDDGETTTVRQYNPDITTELHSVDATGAKITVLFGSAVADQAVLTGASATAGGTVTYTVYSDDTCQTVYADAGTKLVSSGVVPASSSITFPDAGTYYWQASYSGDAANAPAISVCTDEVLTVTTPDLDVEKTVSVNDDPFVHANSANPGDVLTYRINVTNSGNGVATDVPVSDDISAILAHADYNDDCSLGCSFASETLSWTIPSIAVGATVTLTYSVTLDDIFPEGQTVLPNVVVVTGPGSNCEADSGDADCEADTTVEAAPDLDVTKLVATGDSAFGPTSVAKPGDVLNYQITIQNTGDADATGVDVSDNIAALLAHADYNDDCNLGCSFVSPTLSWNDLSVAAGGSIVLTYSVTLSDSFPTGTTNLPNVVVVIGPGSNCAAQSEDPDCDTNTIVTTSVLSIDKSFTGNTAGTDPDLGVPAANVGDTLHYSLTYHGEGPIVDAVITDVLPQGLEYVAGSAAGDANFAFVSYNSATRTLKWVNTSGLPDLADGDVTYDVKVTEAAPEFAQPLINVATIVGHTPDEEELTDTDTASVAVLAPPLELTPPPTSTITPQTTTSNPGFSLMLILLAVAGLTLGIGFITPAPARVRRREGRR